MMASCLLSLLFASATVHSLKCYVCDSTRGTDCGRNSPMYDCGKQLPSARSTFEANSCVKIVVNNGDGDEFVGKNCAFASVHGPIRCDILAGIMAFRVPGIDRRNMKCHVCNRNRCNLASDPNTVAFPIVAVSIIYLLL